MPEIGKHMSEVGCVCRSDAATVRQVDLFGDRRMIGLFGLDLAFRQVYAMGKPPGEAVAQELLAMIKTENYVPPSMAARYAAGLLRLYSRFYEEREAEARERPADTRQKRR